MRVEEFMTSPVLTVPPEASRDAIAALLVSHGIASAPVVDHGGRLVGMVTESGVLAAGDGDTARDVMLDPTPIVSPAAGLSVLVARLVEAVGRALPVVREGDLVGIVGRRDVLRRVAAGDRPREDTHRRLPTGDRAEDVHADAAPASALVVVGRDPSPRA